MPRVAMPHRSLPATLKEEDMRLRVAYIACCLLAPAICANAAAPPRLMLPTIYSGGIDVSQYWISEKLDGVRGHWDGHRFWARSGAAIDPPPWFTAHWPRQPLDGELWIARGHFDAISTLVRTPGVGEAGWRQVHFMVFDLPADRGAFEQRVLHMRALGAGCRCTTLRIIPQFRLHDRAQLDARLRAVVAAGGEGLVLQHRDAHYTAGRSDTLLKYKPHDDAEARVVAHTAGQGKYAGQLGALIVRGPEPPSPLRRCGTLGLRPPGCPGCTPCPGCPGRVVGIPRPVGFVVGNLC